MDLFKILTGLTVAMSEVQKALSDKEITVKEMCDIVDNTLSATVGLSLNDIGLKISKTKDGKTKLELVIGSNK